MGKVWVLDTETKGTGAEMVPLEKTLKKPAPKRSLVAPEPSPRRAPRRETREPTGRRTSSPLPPGHVRKKATGEIGRIRSVDPKAGTASVLWLKQGRTSTVRLSAISRR
jgi:hypothetical protein